jgi:Ca-activated chloride channel family protein
MKTRPVFVLVVLLLGLNALAQWHTAPRAVRTVRGTVFRAYDSTGIAGVEVWLKGTPLRTHTDPAGRYSLLLPAGTGTLRFSAAGFVRQEVPLGADSVRNVWLWPEPAQELKEVTVVGYAAQAKRVLMGSVASAPGAALPVGIAPLPTEAYATTQESGFQDVRHQPLTTFSADVDRASYANVRRFLNQGQRPPKEAVRVEEFLNYFDYGYPQPVGKHPVAVDTELSESPWNPGLKLLRVGVQARHLPAGQRPASNLVFLIDVSGSMADANKLPLVKAAFRLLVDQLSPQDRVAVVVYAGAAGLVLPSTPGSEKMRIRDAIDALDAGGSTAGGAGIQLAYQIAEEQFLRGGTNRVILATDGDFNVGTSGEGELRRLVEEKRQTGVFLSVLGFGMGNLKDSKMELLADHGNGQYAYIDNAQEAQKVFVQELGGTLCTVAKDVKLQLEFNPRLVRAYRLIGYENRRLANEEFNDDRRDAGDLGAGHSVTALYELVPAGADSPYLARVDSLRYQRVAETPAAGRGEWATVKIRYKYPDAAASQLLVQPVAGTVVAFVRASESFRFAAAVTEFGLLLRDSEFRGQAHFAHAHATARRSLGTDAEGYRAEFLRLVRLAQRLPAAGERVVAD